VLETDSVRELSVERLRLRHRAQLGADRTAVRPDGIWQGQRLLPEGWAQFVSTPAPAWKQPVYGGLFWVNGDGAWPIPRPPYFAKRAGGQRTVIIPRTTSCGAHGAPQGDRAGMNTLKLAARGADDRVPAR